MGIAKKYGHEGKETEAAGSHPSRNDLSEQSRHKTLLGLINGYASTKHGKIEFLKELQPSIKNGNFIYGC